jgi:hypothetical protein
MERRNDAKIQFIHLDTVLQNFSPEQKLELLQKNMDNIYIRVYEPGGTPPIPSLLRRKYGMVSETPVSPFFQMLSLFQQEDTGSYSIASKANERPYLENISSQSTKLLSTPTTAPLQSTKKKKPETSDPLIVELKNALKKRRIYVQGDDDLET